MFDFYHLHAACAHYASFLTITFAVFWRKNLGKLAFSESTNFSFLIFSLFFMNAVLNGALFALYIYFNACFESQDEAFFNGAFRN